MFILRGVATTVVHFNNIIGAELNTKGRTCAQMYCLVPGTPGRKVYFCVIVIGILHESTNYNPASSFPPWYGLQKKDCLTDPALHDGKAGSLWNA